MNLTTLNVMIADAAAPAMEQNPMARNIMTVAWMVMIFAMFYFMMIRPQQKRAKELTNLLKAIKPGDKIVTSSGIIGTVVSVKDKSIALRSAETKIEVLKSTITEITERSGETPSEA